jgi:hypothetical protein
MSSTQETEDDEITEADRNGRQIGPERGTHGSSSTQRAVVTDVVLRAAAGRGDQPPATEVRQEDHVATQHDLGAAAERGGVLDCTARWNLLFQKCLRAGCPTGFEL